MSIGFSSLSEAASLSPAVTPSSSAVAEDSPTWNGQSFPLGRVAVNSSSSETEAFGALPLIQVTLVSPLPWGSAT